MRRLGSVLVISALLTGCAGNGDDGSGGLDPGSTTPTAAVLEIQSNLPQWELGQAWMYRVEQPGLPTETFQMVVAEDRDDLWVVASNNRTQAVNHAVYSTNPMLGRIGKETLSPFQSGEPVRMYQFPLTDGKSWDATFFGQPMKFSATYVGDIDSTQINPERNLPRRIDGFRITASGGGLSVAYNYVEAVEWFTEFELRDQSGERVIRLSLADFQSDYHGSYYFYRGAPDDESLIQEGSHNATNIPPVTSQTLDATVPSNFADLVALGIIFVGKPGTVAPRLDVTLTQPSGATVLQRPFIGAREVHFLQDVEGAEGTWRLQLNMTGTLSFEARVFGISKFAEGAV